MNVLERIARAAAGVALCLMLAWAVHTSARRQRYLVPAVTEHSTAFRTRVRDGDLLLTRASNNWMSRLHSLGLGTPVAHVGIALVETQGDPHSRVFMFESGAPRGSQLRDLDGYMHEGADYLWWRPLTVAETVRTRIRAAVERLSRSAYSWSFLADLPQELVNVRAPFAHEADDDDVAELGAASCAELVARVYELAGILSGSSGDELSSEIGERSGQRVLHPRARTRARWLPMHFLDDRMLPWANRGASPLQPPINVVFPAREEWEAQRWKAGISKLASTLLKANTL